MPTTKHKGSPSGPYALTKHQVTLSFGVVAASAAATQTAAVPGLQLTDVVTVNGAADLGGLSATARVSAADTLEVTVANVTAVGITANARVFNVGVMRFTG